MRHQSVQQTAETLTAAMDAADESLGRNNPDVVAVLQTRTCILHVVLCTSCQGGGFNLLRSMHRCLSSRRCIRLM